MTTEQAYQLAEIKLNEYIANNHMRHTPERLMVLRHVCQMPQPFVAEQLIEACQVDRLSRSGIYNILQTLLSARILHSLNKQYGLSEAQYELTVVTNNHMQVICHKCGRVAEFREVAITNIIRSRAFSNFNAEHFSLYVYGTCKTCRRLLARGIAHNTSPTPKVERKKKTL